MNLTKRVLVTLAVLVSLTAATLVAQPARVFTGHFVDSPVGGMVFNSESTVGYTDEFGTFTYGTGETLRFWIGSCYLGQTKGQRWITPLDFFEGADLSDPRVVNMARLIQSLDDDANPRTGIMIQPIVVGCLDMARDWVFPSGCNFSDDVLMELLLQETVTVCDGNPLGIELQVVSAADAQAHLERSLKGMRSPR